DQADRRADRPARGRRAVPEPESDRKLPAAEPSAVGAGGRNPGLAADLQLQRAVLQHRHPAVPGLDHRQPGRLHGAAVLRNRRQIGPRTGRGQLRQIATRSVTPPMTTETKEATLWICESCGFIYDPAIGDPDGGIPPGTAFEDIPTSWFCP